jgi:hypothetical protein
MDNWEGPTPGLFFVPVFFPFSSEEAEGDWSILSLIERGVIIMRYCPL